MHTRVEDVMTRDVVTVGEKTAYKDIIDVMHRSHVSAVPVLDSTGQVRGVVSATDLLVKETDPDAGGQVHWSPARRAAQRKATGTVAADLMTAPPVTVSPTAWAAEAATLMRRHRINQVLVIDVLSGRLMGMVSRTDVLGTYRRADADIERDVREEVIAAEFGMNPKRFEVKVDGGRVVIAGEVERSSQVAPLMRAIRYVEGVVSATSRLKPVYDDGYVPYGIY